MKKLLILVLALAACSKSPESNEAAPPPAAPASAPPAAAPAEMSEKDKAQAHPYPNDLGPDRLPEAVLASYPASVRKGHDLLVAKCAQCHTAARPLNSRFVEVSEAELKSLKASSPALFADKSVRQIEASIWNRYVKRMMSKPGCAIASAEGKAIWEFLAHDSRARKLGAGAAAWEAHRKDLVARFKAAHPKRYEELAAAGDL